MTTIQVKLQDIPGTQMAPSGPSHVVPLISHCFSDLFFEFPVIRMLPVCAHLCLALVLNGEVH